MKLKIQIAALENRLAAMTFAEAKTKVMEILKNDGWQVSENLKIPHATKDGIRLWFKPQSIYCSTGNDFGSARSMWLDTKKLSELAPEVISKGLHQKARKMMKSASHEMSCEDYFDAHFADECDDMIQDMYWSDSYSTDKLFNAMVADAKKHGIKLSDEETWNYDKFFHNVWKSTEKGLS